MEKAGLPELPLVLFAVKCELCQVLTGAEVTAEFLGAFQARRRQLRAVDQSWARGVGVPEMNDLDGLLVFLQLLFAELDKKKYPKGIAKHKFQCCRGVRRK